MANKSTSDILKDTIFKLEKRQAALSLLIENPTAKTPKKRRESVKKSRNEIQYCVAVLDGLRARAAWIG